jgi:Holliday junction DNA helicase RuvA
MIATLSGTVSEKLPELIVIDCSGVGYGVQVIHEDDANLVVGQAAKLYIYENIREQSHDLFGFIAIGTKQLFEQLIAVNGVGPKMALNVLNIGTVNAVRVAIAGGDTKTIQQASGVGKRVAERLIVDLKDKVGLTGVDLATTGLLQGEGLLMQDEAVEALVSLGYTPQDAATALRGIDVTLPTAQRVTQALKGDA